MKSLDEIIKICYEIEDYLSKLKLWVDHRNFYKNLKRLIQLKQTLFLFKETIY